MVCSDKNLKEIFYNECFPRSSRYDARWIAENQMGPNALWLAEWLMEKKVFWEPDCYTFHSAQWWRRHWEKSGSLKMELADTMIDGWRHWARHEHAMEASGYGIFPSDEETLLEDAGQNLALVRVIGQRIVSEDSAGTLRGPDPHVWEPAFMNVCARLMSSRGK